MVIQDLLNITIEKDASDLHLIHGYYPSIRINGELYPLKAFELLNSTIIRDLMTSLLTDNQIQKLQESKEIDLGYAVKSADGSASHRFRVNVYYSRGEVCAALRLISPIIKTPEELGLPPIMKDLINLRQGFVLVTGPTGEGKSTTIASMINEINLHQSQHILTIEDPVEYVYPAAMSIVSQREIGDDSLSWGVSMKSALREDPDIVVVGEMRDYETIQAALTLAETGHLVFSTLHTNSVPQTIDRIVDVFPSNQQNQIRLQLAATLRAIISQRLVPNVDKTKRVPACEILINNPAVASIIRENKTHLIDNVLETSAKEGMITMEKFLFNLYIDGIITRDAALQYATRPRQIERLLS